MGRTWRLSDTPRRSGYNAVDSTKSLKDLHERQKFRYDPGISLVETRSTLLQYQAFAVWWMLQIEAATLTGDFEAALVTWGS